MKLCLRCKERFESCDWCCPACDWRPQDRDGHLSFLQRGAAEDGFDPRNFERLARLEAASFWFQERNQLIAWALGRYFTQTQSLLELGCGTGFVLQGIRAQFPRMRLAGGDMFTSGLRLAGPRLPGVNLFHLDVRSLPFDCEFDVIGAFDVLEHVQEDEAVLSEIFRAVRPGGGLLLTVPQHQFLWSALDEYSLHKRRYSRAELTSKLQRAGFEILRATSFVSLLLPLMLLSRLRYRKLDRQFNASSELSLGRTANFCLGKIMAIERFLIARDIGFRTGGSLLVVATRPGTVGS